MTLRKLFVFALNILLLGFFIQSSAAMQTGESEPPAGAVLCAPGIEGDCLSHGPNAYRKKMAAVGISLPFEKLHASSPEVDLRFLPNLYGRVVTERAPVYGSMEDAASQVNPIYRMEGNFSFVSYEYTDVLNDVRVYMIAPGVWMNAIDVHRIGTPVFQGLVFSRTPRNPFGWILSTVETRTGPNYRAGSASGNWLYREQIIQVLNTQVVDDIEWVQVGQEEWLEKRYIAIVRPFSEPPSDAISGRWIDVNLNEQTVVAYENSRIVFATLISSGVEPFWTRPGLFQITEKYDTTRMTGSFEADRSDYYYLEDVPWAMYFDQARAFHGAYWHNLYGYARSHGCINMSPGDAHWLFIWAQSGDWVYVHDPSGLTPTDPSLYTAGGA